MQPNSFDPQHVVLGDIVQKDTLISIPLFHEIPPDNGHEGPVNRVPLCFQFPKNNFQFLKNNEVMRDELKCTSCGTIQQQLTRLRYCDKCDMLSHQRRSVGATRCRYCCEYRGYDPCDDCLVKKNEEKKNEEIKRKFF